MPLYHISIESGRIDIGLDVKIVGCFQPTAENANQSRFHAGTIIKDGTNDDDEEEEETNNLLVSFGVGSLNDDANVLFSCTFICPSSATTQQ